MKRKLNSEVAEKENVKDAEKESKEQKREHSIWLMKSEPETRVVNGKDVKFSIDDLQEMKRSPWDGVVPTYQDNYYDNRETMRHVTLCVIE